MVNSCIWSNSFQARIWQVQIWDVLNGAYYRANGEFHYFRGQMD